MASVYDYVIIGGGIVGLAIARELRHRDAASRIAVFEKESELGKHASGRNSGVLHSGIYYRPDSWKAKVCAEGRKAMVEYCLENSLPMDRAGKVILPVREGDEAQLEVLLSRAASNGVTAELIDRQQLRDLEPEAVTHTGKALYVPDACVVDPKAILYRIGEQIRNSGVHLYLGREMKAVDAGQSSLIAADDSIRFGHLFNAAGAYADRVAKKFGLACQYTILPFKGIYYRLSDRSGIRIRHLIYSVPDLRVPFLGVHFVRNIQGDTFLGPTVVPALGRENYSWFSGLNPKDSTGILCRLLQQFVLNRQGFRNLVRREGKRFLSRYFLEAVQALAPRVRAQDLVATDKVGIRAQLLDVRKRELVMDFVVESGVNSTHVLNAVSPGFTSAFAFARHVVDQALQ